MKCNRHKELTFSFLKNYSDSFIPYFENFNNPDVAYSEFIIRFDSVTNTKTFYRTVNVKARSEWPDGKIAENIHRRDKLSKTYT